MNIVRLLKKIHDANFSDPGKFPVESFATLLADYGYMSDENLPWWFARIFEDVDSRSAETFYYHHDNVVGSDMSGILLDLARQYGWNVDDEGEKVTILLPQSKVKVVLDREARDPEGKGRRSIKVAIW